MPNVPTIEADELGNLPSGHEVFGKTFAHMKLMEDMVREGCMVVVSDGTTNITLGRGSTLSLYRKEGRSPTFVMAME